MRRTSGGVSVDGVRRFGVISRGVNRCEIRDSYAAGDELFSLLSLVTESFLFCTEDLTELSRVLLRIAFGWEQDERERMCLSPISIFLLSAQFSYCIFALSTCCYPSFGLATELSIM